MFNITNDKRRATVDIDIDLIRYSLEDKSILLLFEKLNQIDDGIKIIVNKKIKPLKHQDYHGKRVNIVLKDSFENQIETYINSRDYISEEKQATFMKSEDVAKTIIDNVTNDTNLIVADIIIERN